LKTKFESDTLSQGSPAVSQHLLVSAGGNDAFPFWSTRVDTWSRIVGSNPAGANCGRNKRRWADPSQNVFIVSSSNLGISDCPGANPTIFEFTATTPAL
jgi:hypothetical protein